MSALQDLALEFSRGYAQARNLHETAQRLAAQVAQAGPDDRDALAAILKTLGQTPDFDEAANRGVRLEDEHKAAGDRLGHTVRNLAAAAVAKAAHLAAQAQTDQEHIPVADFGTNGVRVVQYFENPQVTRYWVCGLIDNLGVGHRLRTKLAGVPLPTSEDARVVYLGPPVTGLDGRLVPAPSYSLSTAVSWTVQAGRIEKEQEERYAQEQEEISRKAKEQHTRPLTVDQLAAQVAYLTNKVAVLEADKQK